MPQNTAVVCVTYELLVDALGLPKDMRVIAITQRPEDVWEGALQIVVEHPALPQRVEGAAPRVMTIEALARGEMDQERIADTVARNLADFFEDHAA